MVDKEVQLAQVNWMIVHVVATPITMGVRSMGMNDMIAYYHTIIL